MLAEFSHKSQITIPEAIVEKLGLSQGDKLDIFERDGMICIIPVSVYPQSYIDELQSEIAEIKANIAAGKQPLFDSADALIESLENA